ncbi:hypothetical protein QQ045_029489 [Rhodiola kirilowii]
MPKPHLSAVRSKIYASDFLRRTSLSAFLIFMLTLLLLMPRLLSSRTRTLLLIQEREITLQEENTAYEKAISDCENRLQEKLREASDLQRRLEVRMCLPTLQFICGSKLVFLTFMFTMWNIKKVWIFRVYQVANVKSEWNLIKTFPDLSGTGTYIFPEEE